MIRLLVLISTCSLITHISQANGYSCEQKLGQMIITSPPPEPHQYIGGVIYFGDYIDSLGTKAAMTERFSSHRRRGLIPRFISFDNEGGRVQRLRREHGFRREADKPIKAPSRDVAALNAGIAALNVRDVGGNLNFGTVLDICQRGNPIINVYGRCFKGGADKISDLGLGSVLANSYYDVIPTIKHFPGHGSTTTDSHTGDARITKPWNRYVAEEMQPFINVIQQFEDADYRQQLEQGATSPE